jgi:hypothetical protein
MQSETALKEEIKGRLLDARQEYVNHIKAEVEWRAHYEDKVRKCTLEQRDHFLRTLCFLREHRDKLEGLV